MPKDRLFPSNEPTGFQVWHKRDSQYHYVASVESNALGAMLMTTHGFMGHERWQDNPAVTATPGEHRSTTIGDVLIGPDGRSLEIAAEDGLRLKPIAPVDGDRAAFQIRVLPGTDNPLYRGEDRSFDIHDAAGKEIPFMKGYSVFNAGQIDGPPARFTAPAPAVSNPIDRLEAADRFFAATGATIRHGGASAYYNPGQDLVQMPPLESVHHQEGYYATLAHEMTHWTKHPERLDRDFGRRGFGDAGYAMEELVAEIGSAYLCADLGITPETREDHAAYVASWLKVLKNDTRAIFTAASHAERAAQHLHGYQTPEQGIEPMPDASHRSQRRDPAEALDR